MLMSKKKTKKRKLFFSLIIGLAFLFSTYSISLTNFQIISEKKDCRAEEQRRGSGFKVTKNIASANVGEEYIIKPMIEGLVGLSGKLLSWSMKLLDYTISPDRFNESLFGKKGIEGINQGWTVLRDFLNIFFILMLLLVALGTILGVQKFSDKKVIFSIIAAAILINFSKVIALVIIDISQLGMTFFSSLIHSSNQEFTTEILKQIKMQKVFQGDVTEFFANSIMSIVFMVIMAFVVGVIAVALLVRLVAFYVLIILSPLAMFGIALPGTALTGMKNDWFTKIMKWAFFGPIMLFFLWLAFVVLNAIVGASGWEEYVAGASKNSSLLSLLVPYLAAIYLLTYGFDMAMKNSIGLANKIVGWGNKKLNDTISKAGSGAKNAAFFPVKSIAKSNKVGGYLSGIRNRKYSPLKTKEEREKKNKERREEWEAKGRGKSKVEEYERKQAKKMLKDWEDGGGLDSKKGDKIDKKGSSVERKAKALYDAKNKKFNKADDFKRAIDSSGGDKVLEAEIRKEAKKENLHAMMEYDIQEADKILGRGNQKTILAATKSNATLKMAIDAENERLDALGKTKLSDAEKIDYLIGTGKYDTAGSRFGDSDGKKHTGGFAGSGGRNITAIIKKNAYVEKLDSMSNKDITAQGVGLFRKDVSGGESETTIYLKTNIGPGKRFKNQYVLNKAFSKENANKQAVARNNGIIT